MSLSALVAASKAATLARRAQVAALPVAPLYLPPGSLRHFPGVSYLVHRHTSIAPWWQATRFLDGDAVGHIEGPWLDVLDRLVRDYGADLGAAQKPADTLRAPKSPPPPHGDP